MNESLNLETWRKIYQYISKNTGKTIYEIAEALDIKIPQVERHIGFMKEMDEITIVTEGTQKRYHSKKKRKGYPDKRGQTVQIQIRNIISKSPGIHLSKIAEELQISSPLATYHLRNMEKNNIIISTRDENRYYKRYYLKFDDIGFHQKKILSLLRQEHLFKIVTLLITNEYLKHKELAEELNISPSTLSYHLNRLIEHEIIDVFYHGKEKGFRLKNREELIKTVRRYTLNKSVESFKDIWSDFNLK